MKLQSSLASLAISAVVFAGASEAKATCPNPLPLSQTSADSQITTKYNGGWGSLLGTAISGLVNPPDWGCEGWYKLYQNGGIWVSAETSAHVLLNEIAAKYWGGSWLGTLGYPLDDQYDTTGGDAAVFGFGTMFHKAGASTAVVMDSDNYSLWNTFHASDGALGFPSGDWIAVTGGHKNNFDNGFMTHTSGEPRTVLTGAHNQGGSWWDGCWQEKVEIATRTSGNSLGGYGHVDVHCLGGLRDFYLNTASSSTYIGSSWEDGFDTDWISNSQAGYCSGGYCYATIEVRQSGIPVSVASFRLNP